MTEDRDPPNDPPWRGRTSTAIKVGAALVVVVLAFVAWRYLWIPYRVNGLYAEGHEAYAAGDMDEAARVLGRLSELDPDNLGANVLLGWTHWRLGRPGDAERYFERAYAEDPNRLETIQGLSAVRLALGRDEEVIPLLEKAARNLPLDVGVHTALADAYRRSGRNMAAANLYRELLWRDPANFEAERALLEMFGYPRLGMDATFTLPERPRPEELEVSFRTRGDLLQARQGEQWRSVYMTGVTLSPARPGEFAVSASLEFQTYREWFDQIGGMNANVVRVYAILPPAFYQAFHAYNSEADTPLWLIQGVWLDDLAEDLWDDATTESFVREIRSAVDVVHGRADIACRPGHYCGVYTADVSEWVMGLGVGRDMEPRLVHRTNEEHPDRTSWAGEYVSLSEGNPTEAWFARMFDVAARYEVETYNAQRPLALVSWPALDPLEHPTVATFEEELRIRRERGEQLSDTLPEYPNDLDAVSVDVTRFETDPDFEGGLFALYHVFQHRPPFMYLEPEYVGVSDAVGPNPYLGYLRDLKAAHPGFPLVIGAFGLATSLAPADIHPLGWHNGGLSEEEQADLAVRFSGNIRNAGMAGGIVFEWLDEWWKQVNDPFVSPLESSRSADPVWLNRLDPEEQFGLVGFRPYRDVPLLRGRAGDWEGAEALYVREPGEGATSGGSELLQAVYGLADYAYLHLRLDLRPGTAGQWSDRSLWIALNTLSGEGGSPVLPGGVPLIPGGSNFLVQLDGLSEGRLLVAESYNPWEIRQVPGRPDMTRVMTKSDMDLAFDSAGFEEMIVEANPPVWSSDGAEYPPVNYDRSALPFGSADPESPDFDSRATWRADPSGGVVEIRIPWASLLVMDPSSRLVFGGTDGDRLQTRPTEGLSVAVLALEEGPGDDGSSLELLSSFPGLGRPTPGGRQQLAAAPSVFAWDEWTEVRYRPYLKPAYFSLRDLWGSWPRWID